MYNGDSTKIFNWKTNVLYIDPPWGGPDYREKTNIDLYMGTYRLDEYIHHIKRLADYIFLKVPSNYNFNRLDGFDFKRFQIRKFFLVWIKLD